MMIIPGCNARLEKDSMEDLPNILFCIADDVTWMHMGAYGCDWVKTPSFDRIAREGILFNNAYTPNAKCAPSRACILTGRYSWQLESGANHLSFFPARFKTFPEVLLENGFHVGYTGKGYVPGIALHEDGSTRDLIIKRYNDRTVDPPTSGIYVDDYTGNFQDFMNERTDDRPFFFWYGGWEPHRAYQYASGLELGNKNLSDVTTVPGFWPDVDSVRTDMLDYAYEIEYFDKHLGNMLDILEECGELDNTLILVTSDNGMPFPRVKSNAYEMSNHLPLAVMWAKEIKNPGRVVDDFVSFTDFAPTFLELAGISEDDSGISPMAGRSLTDIFFSKKEGVVNPLRDHTLIGKEKNDPGRPGDAGYPIRGIVEGDYLYIMNHEPSRWPSCNPECGYTGVDGSPTKTVVLDTRLTENQQYWQLNFAKRSAEEMYNIVADPFCLEDLSEMTEYRELKESLKSRLNRELESQGDPRMRGEGYVFDNYPFCFDRYVDFYKRYTSGEDVKAGWVNLSDFREKID